MVSLWPWKGADNSPASFEKALSALATKITNTQAQLTFLQQRSRRAKALWTLYTSFAYILCFLILFLVVGWKNWTAVEYTVVSGSPLVIWLIRTGITTYYTYRIDTVTQRLEDQQSERTRTIDKLKAATKYDSTQELLQKYGGEKPKPKPKKESTRTPSKGPKSSQIIPPGRTSFGPPPPTANIVRPTQISSQPSTPQAIVRTPPTYTSTTPISANHPSERAEFAPNAFSAPPQFAVQGDYDVGGHWYDRVLDLLMGEDETSPKNRIVLICEKCRLVNGQAPPGTKSIGDLGQWRCYACGTLNGEADEAAKVVQQMKEKLDGRNVSTGLNTQERIEAEKEELSEASDDVELEQDIVERGLEDSASGTIEVKPAVRGRPKGSQEKT